MNKEILNHIIEIKESVASIKEEIRASSQRIQAHDICIKELQDKHDKLNLKFAYYGGGIAVIVFVMDLAVNFLVK